jgi:beta-N-acetylhexosaminidase
VSRGRASRFLIAFGLIRAFELLVFEVPITVGSISSKAGKHMNRKSRDAQRSIRSVIRPMMSKWLLMAAGAGLVLSALFAAPVAAAPWSLAQSLNQLLMVSGQFSDPAASAPYATQGVGGFVFFNSAQECSGPVIQAGIAALNADATAAGQVVPWMSTDEEGGTVQRLACVIGSLPSARQMPIEWTTSQVQANLAAHGAAMRSLGMTMDLAPVMDTSPANWPYNDESNRSFSNTYSTVTAYGLAFANGLQSSGIVPVAKHFPGLGHAVGNTDQEPATDPSFATLQGDDLIPFEQAINAGLPVVMVGHPSVPGLTGTVPASLSPATYQYLRNTLHFAGVAMTDSLGAGAIADFGYSQPAAAVAAIEAGADMAMIDATQWQATLSALESAVNSGALPPARVNASVLRILKAKGLVGHLTTSWTSLGGGLVGGPALASMNAARLDIFVRAHGMRNEFYLNSNPV